MGYCLKPQGRVSVEVRRESFTIHYGPGRGLQEPEEDVDFDHNLDKFWREVPHPEFSLVDLDDTIKALQAAKRYMKAGRRET